MAGSGISLAENPHSGEACEHEYLSHTQIAIAITL
jgi:hypothetical protein